jgi:sec-independent protein translocase protein TatA
MDNFLFVIGSLGPTELIIILAILLLLFGGSRLPSLARGLGESMRAFKKALSDESEETKENSRKA